MAFHRESQLILKLVVPGSIWGGVEFNPQTFYDAFPVSSIANLSNVTVSGTVSATNCGNDYNTPFLFYMTIVGIENCPENSLIQDGICFTSSTTYETITAPPECQDGVCINSPVTNCTVSGPGTVGQNRSATFNLFYANMGSSAPVISSLDISGNSICGGGATLGANSCTIPNSNGTGTCSFTCGPYSTLGASFPVSAHIQSGSLSTQCLTSVSVGASIAGECGTAATQYPIGSTSYGANPQFCSKGTPVPAIPDFPGMPQSLWVASAYSSNVKKLDLSGTVLKTSSVGSYPYGIAIDASGNVWVTNYSSNNVKKLDLSGTLLWTRTVGISPVGVALDPSGNIWVTNYGSSNVTKLNGSTGDILGTFRVGASPYGIAVDASGNVWVANYNSNPGSVTKLHSDGTPYTGSPFTVGTSPAGVAVDGAGNIWVTNYGSGNVTNLNGSTGAKIGTYTVGTGLFSLGDFTGFALQNFVLDKPISSWTCTGENGGASSPTCPATILAVAPPQVSLLNKADNYCGFVNGNGLLTFSWVYTDANSPQAGYRLQIREEGSSFDSPKVDFDILGSDLSKGVTVASEAGANQLAFGKTYYWRGQVYNENGTASDWVNGNSSFKTPSHSYPAPHFSASPASTTLVNGKADIAFTDSSICFSPANNNSKLCPAVFRTYTWDFKDTATCSDSSCQGDTSHIYTKNDLYRPSLTICDNHSSNNGVSYCCTADFPVQIKSALGVPNWQEISPF